MWKKINVADRISDLTDDINNSFNKTIYTYEDINNPDYWDDIDDEQAAMIKGVLETILGLDKDSIKDCNRIEINLNKGFSWVEIYKEERLIKRA